MLKLPSYLPPLLLVLLGATGPVGAHADDGTADAAAARSPGDMTVEERAEMMRQANAYNTCVYEQAIAQVDADPDIRRVADLAMGACENHLDDLGTTITGWGMPPYFAEGFTRTVRDRAVHRLMPELAIRKAR
ncbi:MAG: hypothetical protein RLW61_15755 [Gammaproteobacteria bacterium]